MLVAHRAEDPSTAGEAETPGGIIAIYDDTIYLNILPLSRENVVMHELGHSLLGTFHSLPGIYQQTSSHNPRLGHFSYIEPSPAGYDDNDDGVQDVFAHSAEWLDAMSTQNPARWSDYTEATWRAILPWLWRRY